MSRKTIVFKMPRAEAARASEAAAPPVVASAGAPAGDRWILEREGAVPAAPAASTWLSIDLAADRSLAEAVALSVALPTMLGWFWFSNAISRYRRIFTP